MATAARGTRAGSRSRAKPSSARNANTRGRSASRNGSARRDTGASRSNSGTSRSNSGTSRSNGAGSGNSIAIPFVSATLGAAAGVAGGVVLGRTALSRHRTDCSGLARQIGEAGRQFGKLAGEVRNARETAEQVGKVPS